MATSISSLVSYAAPSDLMNYVSPAQLGDWCSNDGTRVSAASLPTNGVVLAALAAASGEFESAVIRGGRYQPADFANLAGVNLQHVVRLVCNRAKFILWSRATRKGSDEQIPPGCKEAADELDRLGRGEHVFAFLETANASGGEVIQEDGLPIPTCPQPPPSARATPYFGHRLGQ